MFLQCLSKSRAEPRNRCGGWSRGGKRLDGVDVRLVGRVSALVDNGSPIILGSRGRHHGTPFEVTGRLQVQYGRGTWNEWFISFADGTSGWLADAQGQPPGS